MDQNDNNQKVNVHLKNFFNRSISPSHSLIYDNQHIVNELNELLFRTKSYIAGGIIVKSLTSYRSFKNDKEDIDIYVNQRNVAELLGFFIKNGLFYVSSTNIAPAYDQSFFRKNNISARFYLTAFGRTHHNYTIDVMVIPDEIKIEKVIQNFDLTFCEVWWDGKKVGGTNIEDTINKTGSLKKDYEKALIEDGNIFILNRIRKYNKRGFTIKYSDTVNISNKSINYGKKLKSVNNSDEWVARNLYIAMQKMFNYEVFEVDMNDSFLGYDILHDKYLWYIDNILNKYTITEIVRLANENEIFDLYVTKFNSVFNAEKYNREHKDNLVLTKNQKFLLCLIYSSSELMWVAINDESPPKNSKWRKYISKFVGLSETQLFKIYDFAGTDFSSSRTKAVLNKKHNFNKRYDEEIKKKKLEMEKFYNIVPESLNLSNTNENEEIKKTCTKISDDELTNVNKHPVIQEQLRNLSKEKSKLSKKWNTLTNNPNTTDDEMKYLRGQIYEIEMGITKFRKKNVKELNEIREMEKKLKNPEIENLLKDSKNFVMVIPGDVDIGLDNEILCYDLNILYEKAKNYREWMIECIGDEQNLIDIISEEGNINEFTITKTLENIVQIIHKSTKEIKYEFKLDYEYQWYDIMDKFTIDEYIGVGGGKHSYGIRGVGITPDLTSLDLDNDSFFIKKTQKRPLDQGYDRQIKVDQVNTVFYCAIPVEGGYNNFIPVSQLRTLIHLIENENLRMCYLTPSNDETGLQKTIYHTSNYANAFNDEPNYVSTNHCQFGSQIMLYDIEICNSRDTFDCHTPDCVESMNSFISKYESYQLEKLLYQLENYPDSTKLKVSNVSVDDHKTTFDTLVLFGDYQLILFDSENNKIMQYDIDNNLKLNCCSEPGKINLTLENTIIKASVESSDDLLNICVLKGGINNFSVLSGDNRLDFMDNEMFVYNFSDRSGYSINYDNINVSEKEREDVSEKEREDVSEKEREDVYVISAKITGGVFISTVKFELKYDDFVEYNLILCKVYRIFLPLEIIIKGGKKIVLDPVSKTLRLYSNVDDEDDDEDGGAELTFTFEDLTTGRSEDIISSPNEEDGIYFKNIETKFEFDDEYDDEYKEHKINTIKYMVERYSKTHL